MKELPTGGSWHVTLLNNAVSDKIITSKLKDMLIIYLGFRHYFSHAYAMDLYAEKLEDLVDDIGTIYQQYKNEIQNFLSNRSI